MNRLFVVALVFLAVSCASFAEQPPINNNLERHRKLIIHDQPKEYVRMMLGEPNERVEPTEKVGGYWTYLDSDNKLTISFGLNHRVNGSSFGLRKK